MRTADAALIRQKESSFPADQMTAARVPYASEILPALAWKEVRPCLPLGSPREQGAPCIRFQTAVLYRTEPVLCTNATNLTDVTPPLQSSTSGLLQNGKASLTHLPHSPCLFPMPFLLCDQHRITPRVPSLSVQTLLHSAVSAARVCTPLMQPFFSSFDIFGHLRSTRTRLFY